MDILFEVVGGAYPYVVALMAVCALAYLVTIVRLERRVKRTDPERYQRITPDGASWFFSGPRAQTRALVHLWKGDIFQESPDPIVRKWGRAVRVMLILGVVATVLLWTALLVMFLAR